MCISRSRHGPWSCREGDNDHLNIFLYKYTLHKLWLWAILVFAIPRCCLHHYRDQLQWLDRFYLKKNWTCLVVWLYLPYQFILYRTEWLFRELADCFSFWRPSQSRIGLEWTAGGGKVFFPNSRHAPHLHWCYLGSVCVRAAYVRGLRMCAHARRLYVRHVCVHARNICACAAGALGCTSAMMSCVIK